MGNCCTFGVPSLGAIILGHVALGDLKRTGKGGQCDSRRRPGDGLRRLPAGHPVLCLDGVWRRVGGRDAVSGRDINALNTRQRRTSDRSWSEVGRCAAWSGLPLAESGRE
ncbi:DUF4190 domain-containing protein [Micromonospora sp. CA-246542]|uniref:DUF4190 domain-containing protein n=1 Tax=Micromonospora sp. CA-246542 TaxID=3239959 RepID=UPI003D8C4406